MIDVGTINIKYERNAFNLHSCVVRMWHYPPNTNRLGRVLGPYGGRRGWIVIGRTEQYVDAETRTEALRTAIDAARTWIKVHRRANNAWLREIRARAADPSKKP